MLQKSTLPPPLPSMFQVVPVVEGQSSSIDPFGFYVSLLLSPVNELSPTGASTSSTMANHNLVAGGCGAACSDAASDATGVSTSGSAALMHSSSNDRGEGHNASGNKQQGCSSLSSEVSAPHAAACPPPLPHPRHALADFSQADLSRLEREESFWLSHIIQYMYLRQKRRSATVGSNENVKHHRRDNGGNGMDILDQPTPSFVNDDNGLTSPTLERELSFQQQTSGGGGDDGLDTVDPLNADTKLHHNSCSKSGNHATGAGTRKHAPSLPPAAAAIDDDEEDVASLHRFHDPIIPTDGGADALLAVSNRIAAAMRRHVVLQGGVAFPTLRRIVWGFFSGALQRSPVSVTQHHTLYLQLVATPIDAEISDVIQRDLGRTLPTHCLFRDSASVGQVRLRRVLCAYAALDPVVGYCQGMGFVVSMLLVHMPEEEAFWAFTHMMQGTQFAMRQLYLPGFPLLQQFFIILRRLLRTFLPTLHKHFDDEGLDVAFFAAQWYMTLFVYQLPIGVAARIWDIFLSRGWVVIFQTALALLQWDSELLLTMTMEDSLLYLKEFHEGKNEEELMRRTLDVPLHEEDLRTAMTEA